MTRELEPTHPIRPTTAPRHAGVWGAVVTWFCRLVVGATQALLVYFAYATAAQPSCGPWPKPDRWPTLLPVLGVTGLGVLAAWWFIGWLVRLDTTVGWLACLFGVVAGVIIMQFAAILVMSLMTFC